jgi:galactonate dehydratase
VPVHELLGGPTRTRVRVYAHASTPERIREKLAQGFTAFKTGPLPSQSRQRVTSRLRRSSSAARSTSHRSARRGEDADIGIDFHGAISPATAKLLIKALEPHQPMFIEEPVQCQNVDIMADIARGTHLPIATGERFSRSGAFASPREARRDHLAAGPLPRRRHHGVPADRGHGRGLLRRVAPHNRSGRSRWPAGIQLAASIPNFLCQEQVSLGDGYLKEPFVLKDGYIDVPSRPGLGIELDENALASRIDHDWKNRETYDPDDGSVVDW